GRGADVNPGCRLACYGLYATLNAGRLLTGIADSVMSGELEASLVDLVRTLENGSRPKTQTPPVLAKLPFPPPSRAALPSLKKYAHLDRADRLHLVGY